MQLKELIDGYDLKARLIPTAIALMPSFWTAYYFRPSLLSDPFSLAGSGLASIALIYLASMFCRDLGVRWGAKFWSCRGGLPSTRLARMRDPSLSYGQKTRIGHAVMKNFGIALLSLEDESRFPEQADRRIVDAFRETREYVRRFDHCGLVSKHGAEYGFARNLCGCRSVFAVQSVVGFVVCGLKGASEHWILTSGCLGNGLLLLLWIPFAWLFLPRMLRLNAEAYATRTWITFLTLTNDAIKKPNGSVELDGNDRPIAMIGSRSDI